LFDLHYKYNKDILNKKTQSIEILRDH
jgi:hypothetical protein